MEYLFKNLSPEDFEELAQDILSKELAEPVERFKPGKDGGIDLRLLSAKGSVIGQVKHMPGTYGSSHARALRKEYSKAIANPTIKASAKYILILSTNLSIQNKQEIVSIYHGIIKSESDIFGYEDIEHRLNSDEQLVRRHYKLWISSGHVLHSIFNNKVIGKSEDYFKGIIENKSLLFVKTESFDAAMKKLEERRVLLLTGEPGIGKTTLSEFLSMAYAGRGFQFVYCDDIDDADSAFERDKKQIFLLDDFLGSNFLESFAKKEESKILRFIDRVEANVDKVLILNSRTTIYSQAFLCGIHWAEKDWDSKKYHIDVTKYTAVEKAKLLYNHLRFRGLEPEYLDVVCKDRAYIAIIKHDKFNPRIIEFITTHERVKDVTVESYLQYILSVLNNPAEIWKPAYVNQINDEQKWLLQTLFTLQGNASDEELCEAFEKRLQFEVKHHGFKRVESIYKVSIKSLQDGFISWNVKQLEKESKNGYWTFLNPSVFDFLRDYLIQNQEILKSVVDSIHSFCQWTVLYSIPEYKSTLERLKCTERICKDYNDYLPSRYSHSVFELFAFSAQQKTLLDPHQILFLIAEGVENLKSSGDLSAFDKILFDPAYHEQLAKCFESLKNRSELSLKFLCLETDLESINTRIEWLSLHFDDWDDYCEEIFKSERLLDVIVSLAEDDATALVDDDDAFNTHTDYSELENRLEALKSETYSKLLKIGFTHIMSEIESFKIDCIDKANDNFERAAESAWDDDRVSSRSHVDNSDFAIDRVFLE